MVDTGQETDGSVEGVTHLRIDFRDNTLTINLKTILSNPTWNAAAFNDPVFTSVIPFGIATAHVDPSTTMAGFNNSRISLSPTDIAVNWNGLSYIDGTRVQIDFTFNPIPEPVSLTLFGLALSGMAATQRWKRVGPVPPEASN